MAKNNLKNKLTLVILGRSGSGKGTQTKYLLAALRKGGVKHIETGRILRKLLADKKNPTTILAKKIMSRGDLVPAWLAAYIWLKEIVEGGRAENHLIFDGSPRSLWEAELLDDVFLEHGRGRPLGIYLDVRPEEAERRLLLRGREDDTKEAIRNRMKFFSRYVMPVIHHYKKHGRLIRIDGNPPPKIVWREIDQALARKLGRRWSK